jgi:hypothetical protein
VKNSSSEEDPTGTAAPEPVQSPHEIAINATLGEAVKFEVPEGTRHVTLNIEPRIGGGGGGVPTENSFQSCSRSCGGVVLSCLGVLVIIYILAMLIR